MAKSGGLSVRNGLRGGRAPFPPACSAFPRAIPGEISTDEARRRRAQWAQGSAEAGGGLTLDFRGHS